MRRSTKTFACSLTQDDKKRLLLWAQQFQEVVWLDSNDYAQDFQEFRAILAVEAATALKCDSVGAFDALSEYQQTSNDWLFGYLTYDLKNDIEKLSSNNIDKLLFTDLYFFQPKRVFLFSEDKVTMQYLTAIEDEMETDWKAITSFVLPRDEPRSQHSSSIKARTPKKAYLEKANRMLWHIERGDIYEANLCQEFYAEPVRLNPVEVYTHLNEISQTPFACFLKLEHYFALSASPERYIQKRGAVIQSQPIKGTSKRYRDAVQDAKSLRALEANPKERSENIMITDLVRNDLSRIAKKGSVKVTELCKSYTFRQVHQLISTIQCEVRNDIPPVRVLKETFPMGSMTGAPKISAMEIIEQLEDAKRGLYSGAIGYFTPSGDFDFNVVIRSILYNAQNGYVSFSVGGAITAASIPQQEYDECLVKAAALREVLERR
jgi:para-aminobenzoate synthetase component 1